MGLRSWWRRLRGLDDVGGGSMLRGVTSAAFATQAPIDFEKRIERLVRAGEIDEAVADVVAYTRRSTSFASIAVKALQASLVAVRLPVHLDAALLALVQRNDEHGARVLLCEHIDLEGDELDVWIAVALLARALPIRDPATAFLEVLTKPAPKHGVSDEVRALARNGQTIAAIKRLRDEQPMSLKAAKDMVDKL